MGNNNYARGANFERRFAAWLRERGHVAGRSAGSHGAFDVFSMKQGQSCLYQLKSGKKKAEREEIADLRKDAETAGARPFIVTKKRGKEDFFDLFFVSENLELVPAAALTLEEPF